MFGLRVCASTFFFLSFKSQLLIKSSVNSIFVHCSQTHKLHFSVTFSLKMSPTILFTHLKIISLQYFQFQYLLMMKFHPEVDVKMSVNLDVY